MASTIRLHWRGHLRSILSDPPRKKRKHSKNMNEILFLRGKFKRNTHYDNFCVFNAFLCKYGDLYAKTGSACKRNAFRENETLKSPVHICMGKCIKSARRVVSRPPLQTGNSARISATRSKTSFGPDGGQNRKEQLLAVPDNPKRLLSSVTGAARQLVVRTPTQGQERQAKLSRNATSASPARNSSRRRKVETNSEKC